MEFSQKQVPKIGIYSTGLAAYWPQFPRLKPRLQKYGQFIAEEMNQWGEVYNFGLVDTEEAGQQAGAYFSKHGVDLIFCHAATYCTSACILPIHQNSQAKVVILNLQPSAQINYEQTNTEEWLAHCGACPVPEYCNALNRAGIPYKVVNGLLGLSQTPSVSLTDEVTAERPEAKQAWQEIKEWIQAAGVRRTLTMSRFGFLGNTYSGMLDLYSDFTMLQAQLGIHVEVLEMDDLSSLLEDIPSEEIAIMLERITTMFELSDETTAEQMAKKPTREQLEWSAKVACGQEKMVAAFQLAGLTYYYHGNNNSYFERLQSGFIVGHSLLTANHVPCAGEGDLKTNIAMKICDILGIGGSYCEIIVTDYVNQTILLGHDGPFHLAIAEGKPLLRGLGIYHGKKGNGISVEATVKKGAITTVGLTQTMAGRLRMIVSEGESVAGETMKIGNTQTPVKFANSPDDYYDRWFQQAPTHHCAMAIGHHAKLLEKVGYLLEVETVIV